MRRTLLTLLAGLALAPVALHAQPPASSTGEGSYQQNGYYDHTGRWHANEPNPYPDGYFDHGGQFHRYADNNQGGAYDHDGNRAPSDTQGGGSYDRNGNWVPDSGQPRDSGNYDSNGQWRSNGDSYDRGHGDRSYGDDDNGRVTGPDRWSYNERGRNESLDIAARNFALTADSVAREARRHAGSDDRAALDALVRLDRQASYFARAAYQRNRGESIGRAYYDLVHSFVDAQRRFARLRPDGWLGNQFHVLASAMSRLDRRYFGSRAFNGQNPEYGGGRPY